MDELLLTRVALVAPLRPLMPSAAAVTSVMTQFEGWIPTAVQSRGRWPKRVELLQWVLVYVERLIVACSCTDRVRKKRVRARSASLGLSMERQANSCAYLALADVVTVDTCFCRLLGGKKRGRGRRVDVGDDDPESRCLRTS